MFGKLLKYEFWSTSRMLIPLYGLLLLISVVTNLAMRLGDSFAYLKVVTGISIFFYIIAVVATVIVTFVVVIQRFYKNLYGDEGYLSFTLPVSAGAHLLSKTIVSTVWSIISIITALGSACILLIGHISMDQVRAAISIIDASWRLEIGIGFYAFVWVMVGVLIVSVISGIIMFYLSLTIGQMANSRRILTSVGVYFIIYMIYQTVLVIGMFVIIFAMEPNLFTAQTIGGGTFSAMMGVTVGVTALLTVPMYIVTQRLMSKKLNLK